MSDVQSPYAEADKCAEENEIQPTQVRFRSEEVPTNHLGQSEVYARDYQHKPHARRSLAGLTGQDLAQQPGVAAKLSDACQALKNHILNPDTISELTGRLKRRVVLD